MATKLVKPVKREMLAPNRGKTLIVEIEPGDEVTFRVKGKRTRYTVSLHKAFNLAIMQKMNEEYLVKLEKYRQYKKYGGRRVRKPRRPSMDLFNREYQIALK